MRTERLNLLRGIFARKAGSSSGAGSSFIYQEGVRDRNVLPSGKAYTPADLAGYLMKAERGDPTFLYTLYDEMLARDGHLAAEHAKAKLAITGAPLQVLAFPKEERERGSGVAVEIAKYVESQLTSPSVRIDRALGSLFDGLAKGAGGFEVITKPGATADGKERIERLKPIPSHRFRWQTDAPVLLLQKTEDVNDVQPVESFGANVVVLLGDETIGSPARRGLFRKCLAHWITRIYGPGWWAKYVELFGSPIRLGKFPAGNDDAKKQLIEALQSAGAHAWAAVPDNSSIEFAQDGARSMSTPPHASLMEFGAEEISKVWVGATQTTAIREGAGSQASATVHMDVFRALTAARAIEVCSVLRERLVKPLVERNFGPEVADLYTPEIRLRTAGTPDLAAFAAGLKTLVDAGDTEIGIAWAHDVLGIPASTPGEPTLGGGVAGQRATAAPAKAPKAGANAPAEGDLEEESKLKASEGRAGLFSAASPTVDDPVERAALRAAPTAADTLGEPLGRILREAKRDGRSLAWVSAEIARQMKDHPAPVGLVDVIASHMAEAFFHGTETL